jgi:hypothetical protein
MGPTINEAATRRTDWNIEGKSLILIVLEGI